MKGVSMFVVLALAVAASAETHYSNKLEMPAMPPRADQIVHEQDPTAEALLADEQNEDPLLNMLQDAMAKKGDFATAKTKGALKVLEDDAKMRKNIAKQIKKDIKRRAKTQQKRFENVDKFNKLRKHFFSFNDANGHAQPASMMETGMKVKDVRHTKAAPKHLAPVHYSPVPVGDGARQANADLASGADAARKEDWQVHQATYEALHPSALEVKKKLAEEETKAPAPKPLKTAQTAFHHGLDTIQSTKKIIRTPLTKLTLDEAKSQCKAIRDQADTKCTKDSGDTHIFCLTEGTKKTECDKHKMQDAAECKVAHETALNKCYDLWGRAKKNIADARAKAAAPMEHTDAQVEDMTAGTTKCADLMTAAQKKCTDAAATYKSECSDATTKAIEMSVVELQLGATDPAHDASAATDASDSAEALKAAEETLTKETASPELKDAIEKCDLKKNEYKRTCIAAVHEARDTCESLTSATADDNAPTA